MPQGDNFFLSFRSIFSYYCFLFFYLDFFWLQNVTKFFEYSAFSDFMKILKTKLNNSLLIFNYIFVLKEINTLILFFIKKYNKHKIYLLLYCSKVQHSFKIQ